MSMSRDQIGRLAPHQLRMHVHDLQERVVEVEKLRRIGLEAGAVRACELERELELERTDHAATLLRAISFSQQQDERMRRMRDVMEQMHEQVGEAVVRGRERLERFEKLQPLTRPMSHRPQPEPDDLDDRPESPPKRSTTGEAIEAVMKPLSPAEQSRLKREDRP